jgi:DnaJ-class molecular chaperone
MKCATCNGTGVVNVRYEWRGVSGDGEAKCPDCNGTGREDATNDAG